MSEWKEKRIEEIVLSANTGLDAIKRAPIVEKDTGIKCLRIQDVSQSKSYDNWGFTEVEPRNFEKFQLKKNDIIIARTGATIGVNLLIKENLNSVFNNGLIRVRAKETLCDPVFLYYNFRTTNYYGYIESISGGTSTQPNMQINALLRYEILLPSIQEQKAIASLLLSIDDKLKLLQHQNTTIENISEILFKKWFLEEASEEWETIPLSEMANFLNGLACQKFPPKNDIDKLPVLKIKELNSGINENSDWASTDIKPEYIVRNGDVIFAWSASLMVNIWDGQDCILNQHLFKVTSDDYPKWFYYLWCKHHLAEFISIAASHATTMGHIKRGDLDEAKVLIPSPDELAIMTEQAEPLIQKIIANNIQINTLTKLRDSLLPKLMSGEITINTN
jgi:type I restriction enzyme, S subunit